MKILVPVDGSAYSLKAVETACDLAKAKEVAQAKGVTAEVILATGASPAGEIVQVAKDQQADLVVIGSRGLTGKTRSFLGSTASQVVTYSPCSVLVVKTQD